MWIESLSPDKARSIFGDFWQEIVTMTLDIAAGKRPSHPEGLSPEEYAGALYHYGENGASVYLFLKSWQCINRPGGIIAPAASEHEILKIEDRMALGNPAESPRWREALREAGYQQQSKTLSHVWRAAMKVGLEVGSHLMKFIAGASAGELAQMPNKDLHFFLDIMPWVRAGQLPCGWDTASNRLIVEWIDPEQIPVLVQTEAYEENLWPTTGVGMRVRDEEAFTRMARESTTIILVCDASPAILQYIGQPGYSPRPPALKGVTRKAPPHVGLVAARANGTALPPAFEIPDEIGGLLIRNQAGDALYDGFKLHGVYDFDTGRAAYSETFRHEMNQRLGVDLIQEGPYDTLRGTDDTPPWHPHPPVTAFLPDRAPVRLPTREEMQEFYEAFGLEWKGTSQDT